MIYFGIDFVPCKCGSNDLDVTRQIITEKNMNMEYFCITIKCKKCGLKQIIYSKNIWNASKEFVREQEQEVFAKAEQAWKSDKN